MSLENSLVLGRYRVLWPLESKKLIKTYIARDEHRDGLAEPVLIKHHLHDLGEKDSVARIALLAELGRLSHLRHAGVVSLLDYGALDQGLITAHGHQSGLGLRQLCEIFDKKQLPFPPHLAVYIARSVLDTLHYCHTYEGGSFKHGRLTLGCIQLATTGMPMIADFGLASLEEAAAEAEMHLGFLQTRMSYSAPELTRGGAATVRGDTYSVALLLYRMLAGSNPFRGRSIPETLQRVLQLAPAELLMPGWKGCERANVVLRRALDKDPAARFADCSELRAELGEIDSPPAAVVREELASLVRRHASGDWAQVARLMRTFSASGPESNNLDAERLLGAAPHESKAPAFVSGLLTDQPRSVTEHTRGALRDKRDKSVRRRQLMVPTVLIPAAAIMLGLFLGRLGGSRAGSAATRAGEANAADAKAAEAPVAPLISGLVEELRGRLQGCGAPPGSPAKREVELEFGGAGELTGVRLQPSELSQSRLGACLLETAWRAELRAPGAMSIKIPLGG